MEKCPLNATSKSLIGKIVKTLPNDHCCDINVIEKVVSCEKVPWSTDLRLHLESGWIIYSNHVHILEQPPNDCIDYALKDITTSYTIKPAVWKKYKPYKSDLFKDKIVRTLPNNVCCPEGIICNVDHAYQDKNTKIGIYDLFLEPTHYGISSKHVEVLLCNGDEHV